MTELKPFSHHFVWLSALYILGSGIINLPLKNADKLTFLGFVIAYILSILLIFAVYKFKILKYPAVLLAVYYIGEALIIFIRFISESLLSERQNFWILLLFLIPLFYLCCRKNTEILNFSLICGIACGTLLIFFFFATFKDFNPENIYIYSFPTPKNLFIQALPYIKTVTLPTLILAVYGKQIKTNETVAITGACVGNAFLLISIFNSVLLFGTSLAGNLSYPYASAISTVTFGNLFSRLDGFSYFIYFVTALIRITVCVKVIKRVFNVAYTTANED